MVRGEGEEERGLVGGETAQGTELKLKPLGPMFKFAEKKQ